MSQLLKVAGGLALLYQLVGSRVSGAILDRFTYDLAGIRRQDIAMRIEAGRVLATIDIRLFLKQTLGPDIRLTAVSLNFSQQGGYLGNIRANQNVLLPNARTVEVPLRLRVPAGSFLIHLQRLLEGGRGAALAPIDISGSLFLSNGRELPVRLTMNFFSFS
ncbi:hypothetical protein [Neolewinella agarilytica]|uniref:Late embryogenesis abundant protein n=1 Tax=Neolewinella agarilytica TaxID=478744 RepID=A0A1H9LYA7_9BACT|nr:hypothetical protein [Neolewinella agarilytica]SER16400.1 hypothetical protein SAMN05444359_12636 [Neolewinella agarilytica]